MSSKCNKCGEKIFDSKAYLKISMIEQRQQEKVDQLAKKIKEMKNVDDQIQSSVLLAAERMTLTAIQECKNALYE